MNLPPDIPREAAVFLKDIGYLDDDRLCVGDTAPVLSLTRLADNTPVEIGAPSALPTVLIFGSYT